MKNVNKYLEVNKITMNFLEKMFEYLVKMNYILRKRYRKTGNSFTNLFYTPIFIFTFDYLSMLSQANNPNYH